MFTFPFLTGPFPVTAVQAISEKSRGALRVRIAGGGGHLCDVIWDSSWCRRTWGLGASQVRHSNTWRAEQPPVGPCGHWGPGTPETLSLPPAHPLPPDATDQLHASTTFFHCDPQSACTALDPCWGTPGSQGEHPRAGSEDRREEEEGAPRKGGGMQEPLRGCSEPRFTGGSPVASGRWSQEGKVQGMPWGQGSGARRQCQRRLWLPGYQFCLPCVADIQDASNVAFHKA